MYLLTLSQMRSYIAGETLSVPAEECAVAASLFAVLKVSELNPQELQVIQDDFEGRILPLDEHVSQCLAEIKSEHQPGISDTDLFFEAFLVAKNLQRLL